MLNLVSCPGPLVLRHASSIKEIAGIYVKKTPNSDVGPSCLNPFGNEAPITVGYVNTMAVPIKTWMENAMITWAGSEVMP